MKWLVTLTIIFASCTTTKTMKSVNPFDGDEVGCGDLIIYKLSEDNTQFISVALNIRDKELSASNGFVIGRNDRVEVRWKSYEGSVKETLCSDEVVIKPRELKSYIAQSGSVELILLPSEIEKAERDEPYLATIIFRKIVFDGLTIDYLKVDKVEVGWLPG